LLQFLRQPLKSAFRQFFGFTHALLLSEKSIS
jgi:hypothetical protein